MESLSTEFKFPNRNDNQSLDEYVADLRTHVETGWNEITKRVNWLLDRIHVVTETNGVADKNGTRFQVFEYVVPGKTKNDDGNWRVRIVEDADNSTYDMLLEIRISGVWTEANRFTG